MKLFKGFLKDELTVEGFVRCELEDQWWQMVDKRIGIHTRENHEAWVKLAKEIKEAIHKRNMRAYHRNWSAYGYIPFYHHKALLADGYKYESSGRHFVKQ